MYLDFDDDAMGYFDNEYLPEPPYTKRQSIKYAADPSKHLPNKNESKLLRKIMSETGLTEEQVREHKIYRKQLTDARSGKGNKTPKERFLIKISKQATKELKLPKEHPVVINRISELIKEKKNNRFFHQPKWMNDV